MITFSRFGKKGRLGNQLFQYASLIGMAKKYGHELALPNWVYAKYFEKPPKLFTARSVNSRQVKEQAYHYTPGYYDQVLVGPNTNVFDFDGYFQSESYWKNAVTEVLDALKFKKEFKDSVAKKYHSIITGKKPIIAVSVRRGDFVNNPNYAQLPVTYYYTALEKFFPDWKTNSTVIMFSDDIEYCKLHFHNYENVFYAENTFNYSDKNKYFDENKSAIEQLCLMSMCDHFVLSHSSFSWWGAYLGETSKSMIIHPARIFDGALRVSNNTSSYYPNRWHTHEESKIDLMDVTFMIPVSYDHSDRKQNLGLNVCMLQREFNTNIIITEQGTNLFDYFNEYGCEYNKSAYKEFHRTKMLNDMARQAGTPIIVNWDADVFISPLQILHSIEMIREERADVVYPYDGRFARVPREGYFKQLEKCLDVGIFSKQNFKGTRREDKLSVGGAVMFNRQKYFEGGGENENFIAYGPEDVEREARFLRLGYKVYRTPGILYHMDHYKGPNSKCAGNIHDKQNHDELDKIYSLKPKELRAYVNTWPLTKEFLNS